MSQIIDSWSSASTEVRRDHANGLSRDWMQQRWAARVAAVREAMTLLAQLQELPDGASATAEIVQQLRVLRAQVEERAEPARILRPGAWITP